MQGIILYKLMEKLFLNLIFIEKILLKYHEIVSAINRGQVCKDPALK